MSLENSILKTLAYFDCFDFPLTAEEVRGYLWQAGNPGDNDVALAIDILLENKKIETKDSYFFFPGRAKIVEKRNFAVAYSEKKLRRAEFGAKLIKSIPFLKAVFVCNSVASETANHESDIDFFIVTSENRLWFVRFFSNLILRALGLRTGKNHSADRICLSFFVGERHLDMQGLRICDEDIYFAYWLWQLIPVYDPENYLEKIIKANGWVNKYLPSKNIMHQKDKWKKTIKMSEKILQGEIGNSYEKILKNIQWTKLRPELKKKSVEGGKEVVIRDGVLKFHENDARNIIRERWLKKIKQYAE